MPPKKGNAAQTVDPDDMVDDDDMESSEPVSYDVENRPPMPAFSTEMPEDDEMRGRAIFLRLLNRRSKPVLEEDVEAGWYYSEEYGAQESITIEPLGFLYKRNYFFRSGDTTELLCSSVGPRKSLLVGYGQPGGKCEECALTEPVIEEVPGKGEVRRSPRCRAGLSFEAYVREWGVVAQWDVFGQAARICERIGQWAKMKGWGNFVVTLRSKGVSSADGVNHVPILRLEKDFESECPPMLREMERTALNPGRQDDDDEEPAGASASSGTVVDVQGKPVGDSGEELPF